MRQIIIKREITARKGKGWIRAVLVPTSCEHVTLILHHRYQKASCCLCWENTDWGMTKLWRHSVLVSPGVLRKTEGMNQYWSGERKIWNCATAELNNCSNFQLQVINFLNVTPARTPQTTGWCNGKLILRWLPQNRPSVGGVTSTFSEDSNCATWVLAWLMINEAHWLSLCNVPT